MPAVLDHLRDYLVSPDSPWLAKLKAPATPPQQAYQAFTVCDKRSWIV
jgi:hypothetical protein